jgi:hypothetical protein
MSYYDCFGGGPILPIEVSSAQDGTPADAPLSPLSIQSILERHLIRRPELRWRALDYCRLYFR